MPTNQNPHLAEFQPPPYITSRLPTPGVRGRLATVLDGIRGMWRDNGAQWYRAAPRINGMDFGLKADYDNAHASGTDNTSGLNTAYEQINTFGGGILELPYGRLAVTGQMIAREGTIFEGGGGRNRHGFGTTAGFAAGTTIVHIPTTPSDHMVVLPTFPVGGYWFNLGFVNMTFITAGGATLGDCLHLVGVSDLYIRNVRVANGFANSLYLDNFQDGWVEQFEGAGVITTNGGVATSTTRAGIKIGGGYTNTTLTLKKVNLRQADLGLKVEVSSNNNNLNIVLISPILESCLNGGADIDIGSDVEIYGGYAENIGIGGAAVPIIQFGVNGSYAGVAEANGKLLVKGGNWAGRNNPDGSGVAGGYVNNSSFLNIGKCNWFDVRGGRYTRVHKALKTTADTDAGHFDDRGYNVGKAGGTYADLFDGIYNPKVISGNLTPTMTTAGNRNKLWNQFQTIGCSLKRASGNVSIADATWTDLAFNDENHDNGDMHSVDTNTERITIPTGYGGKYLLTATVQFASNNTGYRGIAFFLNNTTVIAQHTQPAVNGDVTNLNLSKEVILAAGDYVTCRVYQNSTGALNSEYAASLAPEFTAQLLSM